MKKIEAYQSEDGKFIGTEQQVKDYEASSKLQELYEKFFEATNSYGEYIFALDHDTVNDLKDFMQESSAFKEFCQIVYGFKED